MKNRGLHQPTFQPNDNTVADALCAVAIVTVIGAALGFGVYALRLAGQKARADIRASEAQARIADALDRAFPVPSAEVEPVGGMYTDAECDKVASVYSDVRTRKPVVYPPDCTAWAKSQGLLGGVSPQYCLEHHDAVACTNYRVKPSGYAFGADH